MGISDRVLILIETQAGLQGVAAAQKGFAGLNLSVVALAAVLGILAKVGQDAVENYGKQENALNLLKQATDTQGLSFDDVKGKVEDFIQTNKAYIDNQYDVITAAGQAVRAGNNQTDTLRLLNDALDLAAIKHESVGDAMTSLIKTEAGNSKSLKDLGITTEEYNAIMKDKLLTNEQKHHDLLALIETKTKDGKKSTDDLKQSQDKLNTDWQDFTTTIAPQVVEGQKGINDALDTGVQILELTAQLLDKLPAAYANLSSDQLSASEAAAKARGLGSAGTGPSPTAGTAPTGGIVRRQAARAAGGPVSPGEVYTVGEQGPETLVMGSQGGTVVPNGAGGSSHLHIHIDHGAFIDGPSIDRLANLILRSGRHRPGT